MDNVWGWIETIRYLEQLKDKTEKAFEKVKEDLITAKKDFASQVGEEQFKVTTGDNVFIYPYGDRVGAPLEPILSEVKGFEIVEVDEKAHTVVLGMVVAPCDGGHYWLFTTKDKWEKFK